MCTGNLDDTDPRSIHADCIYHKNQKGKPCEKDLPLLKNDITNNFKPQKPVIYSETVEKAQFWHFSEFYM